jgi:hypothetical protein
MVVKKKAPAKKVVKKRAAASKAPAHPLMVDGKDWDRSKVMEHVCDELATSSRGVGKIIIAGYKNHTLPSYSTIMKWLTEDEELSEQYALAKEAQADFMADEMLEIADAEVDLVIDQNGGTRKDGADVNHKRLRVDTRKWLASKLKPKKYGDKISAELTGKGGGAIETKDTSMTDVARRMAYILSSAVAAKEKDNAEDKEGQ